jgi:hypothetical protein
MKNISQQKVDMGGKPRIYKKSSRKASRKINGNR